MSETETVSSGSLPAVTPSEPSRLDQIERALASIAATIAGGPPSAAVAPPAGAVVPYQGPQPYNLEEPPVAHTDAVIAALERNGDAPRSMETIVNPDGTTVTIGQTGVYFHCVDGHVLFVQGNWLT